MSGVLGLIGHWSLKKNRMVRAMPAKTAARQRAQQTVSRVDEMALHHLAAEFFSTTIEGDDLGPRRIVNRDE
ncbi:MAG: hypothetical protein IPI57_11125 [Candidatus Competibacteraceae bacterium]|nr:hypothetical protein [Candidatus Competibacteraceae bacterium]